ncbi:hypothetical protein HNR26_003148 [Rhizobium rosettiformans]|uniref:Uncharacterized protein n=1 Tax=Rhizobium rosettiformans TaxID=1368430 RepID=A0A7W8HRS2_9HYPH|nr:hypothetical protein [Rhizobium rosettiformans]MBB5277070.1 hypothetical protein [Rhizobium rosettiformans]
MTRTNAAVDFASAPRDRSGEARSKGALEDIVSIVTMTVCPSDKSCFVTYELTHSG